MMGCFLLNVDFAVELAADYLKTLCYVVTTHCMSTIVFRIELDAECKNLRSLASSFVPLQYLTNKKKKNTKIFCDLASDFKALVRKSNIFCWYLANALVGSNTLKLGAAYHVAAQLETD